MQSVVSMSSPGPRGRWPRRAYTVVFLYVGREVRSMLSAILFTFSKRLNMIQAPVRRDDALGGGSHAA